MFLSKKQLNALNKNANALYNTISLCVENTVHMNHRAHAQT